MINEKYKNVVFKTGMYENKRLAIQLISEDGQPLAKVTVNLPYSSIDFNEIIINPYDGNEGIEEFFRELHLIDLVDREVTSGYHKYPVYAINLEELSKYDSSVKKYIKMIKSEHNVEVACKICGRRPEEIDEYVEAAEEENQFREDEKITPTQYVIENEGTYNRITGEFYCTECFLKHEGEE